MLGIGLLSRIETQIYYMAAHLRLHPGAAGACAPQEAAARGLSRAPERVSTPEQPVRVATSGDRALAPAIWRSPQTGRSQLAFARMVRDTHILGMAIGGRGPAASAPVRVAASPLADQGSTISPDGANVACSSGRTGTLAEGQRFPCSKLPAPVATGVPALAVRRDGRWLAWAALVDRGSGLMLVRDFRW